MQLTHNPAEDPQTVTTVERERNRIAAATEAFLAAGGKVTEVGPRGQEETRKFVINPRKTPVYAHLFEAPAPVSESEHSASAKGAPTAQEAASSDQQHSVIVHQVIEVPSGLLSKPADAVDAMKTLRQIRRDAQAISQRLDRLQNKQTH